jgi:hypothetical protein
MPRFEIGKRTITSREQARTGDTIVLNVVLEERASLEYNLDAPLFSAAEMNPTPKRGRPKADLDANLAARAVSRRGRES